MEQHVFACGKGVCGGITGEKKLEVNGRVVEGDLRVIKGLLHVSSVLGALHTLFTLSHVTL